MRVSARCDCSGVSVIWYNPLHLFNVMHCWHFGGAAGCDLSAGSTELLHLPLLAYDAS